MNVREGTRRLALLVGVLGLVAGGVASYATLSDTIDARARYKAFERLATSEAVEQERKYLLSLHLSADAIPDSTNFEGLPPGAVVTPISPPTPTDPLAGIGTPVPTQTDPYAGIGTPVPSGRGDIFDHVAAQSLLVPQPIALAASKDGIKSVLWSKNLEVESIEKGDGEVVISAQQPSLWTYFLFLLFPVAGFVIPWGAIRAIAWVGYGFAESPK